MTKHRCPSRRRRRSTNTRLGHALGSNNNPLLYTGFPELEFDSWLTIGLDGPAGDNEVAPSTIGDLNNGWDEQF